MTERDQFEQWVATQLVPFTNWQLWQASRRTDPREAAMRQAREALASLFNGQFDPDRAKRCSDAIAALDAALKGESDGN